MTTTERWDAALTRALADHCEIERDRRYAGWYKVSNPASGMAYLTDGRTCGCAAADHGDAICKHRALALAMGPALDLAAELLGRTAS
ncbi:MAG TPA: hypothetical protein VHE11_02795 [Steroidobacteraceae bacterium]|nr:hypothetical protein [Steroidobacteraceae bacterium]